MKERSSVVITTIGVAVLIGLITKLLQRGASAKEIRQIHNIVAKNLTETKEVHRKLRRTRGAVNEIH